MILPIGASKFEEALKMGSETFHHLKVRFHSPQPLNGVLIHVVNAFKYAYL